ncbi:MAG: aminopeptidase P family protein, partial [Promicromonosporaceae bacterium]|nr:aminopeptidase P family protein [Promicromonosporaceae bacterium]
MAELEQTTNPVEDHRHRPHSKAFLDFMKSGWAPEVPENPALSPDAPYAAKRRAALARQFPGKRLVIPAGPLKVRSNDTDYRFRPHSAFAHLTGLGTGEHPDAVLVLHPRADAPHEAVLYLTPNAGRDSDEFFADARYGEFWVGRRRTLAEEAALTSLDVRDLRELRADVLDGLGELGPEVLGDDGPEPLDVLLVPDADAAVENLVAVARSAAGLPEGKTGNVDLARAASELRLVKDDREIEHMREAVAATIDGFEKLARAIPEALAHPRGERVIETAFDSHARLSGNTVGYETISASGPNATILHWIDSTGPVKPGDLLLVDAGVEVDSLYTADITRTLPVSGKFTEVQRRVYDAVLAAADAAFAAAQVGAKFIDVHNAAMEVIAAKLGEWGLLPTGVTVESTLAKEGQEYRRWMVHGTSHHLGLDVHDCAQARKDLYSEGILEPGMVFTIEPGLYFQPDDLTVPEEYRGIGVRIEDNILITKDGPENLSAALPRKAADVEAWLEGF